MLKCVELPSYRLVGRVAGVCDWLRTLSGVI